MLRADLNMIIGINATKLQEILNHNCINISFRRVEWNLQPNPEAIYIIADLLARLNQSLRIVSRHLMHIYFR